MFKFLSPHLFVVNYCADLCNELTQVFAKNTHVYFANDRVQLLGAVSIWMMVLHFAVGENRCAEMMQVCIKCPIGVYK